MQNNLRKVYDDLAPNWGIDNTLHDWGGEELKEFASLIKQLGGQKVLDLGCGSGVQAKRLFDLGLEVIGLDLSPKMITEARKKVPGGKFIVGDMTKLQFNTNSFNGVYARASLLHIRKSLMPKVLRAICQILKSGGVLYLAVKEGKGEGEVTDTLHDKKVTRFFSFFKKRELEDFLENAGFKIIKSLRFQKDEASTTWLQVLARKNLKISFITSRIPGYGSRAKKQE